MRAGGGPGARAGDTRSAAARIAGAWHLAALAAVVALSAALNLWRLDHNGWGNEYYSAAVRSMTESWSGFLFAAFDPGGLVAVDKTPLALWAQALSARAFGYSEAAVLVPQALFGAATVVVAYAVVARPWGRVAGLAAALCLAVTPVSVAVARDNNPDALFLLLLSLAVLVGIRAATGGGRVAATGAGALVGLAFLTKMLLAAVVVPGLVAACLLASPLPVRRRLARVAAAAVAAVAVAGSWVAVVALTPASERPWVGSTEDDSILSLLFGYNGVGRVAGQTGGTSSGGGSGGAFSGEPGLFRLFNGALADQIAWLLPLAAGALISLVLAHRSRPDRHRAAFLWAVGGWFAAAVLVLSAAGGIVHTYYVALLAPPMCCLVGAGAVSLAADLRRGGDWPVLPLAAVGATALLQVAIVGGAQWMGWLVPPILAVVVLGAGAMVLGARRVVAPAAATAGLCVALAGLLLAPGVWAASTGAGAVDGVFPGAGPRFVAGLAGGGDGRGWGAGASGGGTSGVREALETAQAEGAGTRYSLIVTSEQEAAPLIIDGERVAAMGGFTGRETVLDRGLIADLVESGAARHFYLGPIRSIGARGNATVDLVRSVCDPVSTASGTGGSAFGRGGTSGGSVLYDCAGMADRLR